MLKKRGFFSKLYNLKELFVSMNIVLNVLLTSWFQTLVSGQTELGIVFSLKCYCGLLPLIQHEISNSYRQSYTSPASGLDFKLLDNWMLFLTYTSDVLHLRSIIHKS